MMTRRLASLILVAGWSMAAASYSLAADPAITTYGERSTEAPRELNAFSFLVGKWQGGGRSRLADGKYVEFSGVTWIGRYVLNGMVIADELHASTPDGKTYLGISLRQFETRRHSWVVEYLNVSNSFLRRQVNPRSGSVHIEGTTAIVISGVDKSKFRESYVVKDKDHFTYTAETSEDDGRSWGPTAVEFTMVRSE